MDRKTLFFLGISILILAVMLYFIGIDEVVEALKLANINYIIIAILIQFAIFFLYTLRWKVLNDLADIKTSIGKTLPILLVGLAINNLTPSGRGGGEPVRAGQHPSIGYFPVRCIGSNHNCGNGHLFQC